MPTLYQIILVALVSTFFILFSIKTGLRYNLRDFCDDKKLSIVAKMLDCDFCFSFWTNFIISIIVAAVINDWSYFTVAIFSTPITRYLL